MSPSASTPLLQGHRPGHQEAWPLSRRACSSFCAARPHRHCCCKTSKVAHACQHAPACFATTVHAKVTMGGHDKLAKALQVASACAASQRKSEACCLRRLWCAAYRLAPCLCCSQLVADLPAPAACKGVMPAPCFALPRCCPASMCSANLGLCAMTRASRGTARYS